MNVTTFWQSLELLQAKIDRDTADFYYDDYKELHYLGETAFCDHIGKITDVPAWSIGRLLNIMADLELDYEYSTIEPIDSIIDSMINAIISKKRQINAPNILDI